jgi:hypothetical protein
VDIPFQHTGVSLSALSPGQVEYLEGSTEDMFRIRMTGPGVYYLTAETGEEATGEIYADTVGIVLYNQADLDALLRDKWNGMKAMLVSGDTESALEYFAMPARNEYRQIFSIISNELPAMAAGMEDIELVYLRERVAKYRIKKDEVIDGVNHRITYYIYFARDPYGNWYIQSF